jgi:hypothetical protein
VAGCGVRVGGGAQTLARCLLVGTGSPWPGPAAVALSAGPAVLERGQEFVPAGLLDAQTATETVASAAHGSLDHAARFINRAQIHHLRDHVPLRSAAHTLVGSAADGVWLFRGFLPMM